MSLEVPSSSGVVEEPAAVDAARLAQLAARRAKKGAKTVSSARLADKSADPRRPKPFRVIRIRLGLCADFAMCCLFSLN